MGFFGLGKDEEEEKNPALGLSTSSGALGTGNSQGALGSYQKNDPLATSWDNFKIQFGGALETVDSLIGTDSFLSDWGQALEESGELGKEDYQPKYEESFLHLDYVNPDAPKGGVIKFGSYGAFDNLNRVAFKGSKAAGLGYVNDTLMRRVWDEAFSLYGLIAQYADMPEDRSSITFYINPNAQFHDGSAITREDVLFSLETFQTKGTPNQKKTYGKVVSTEMIGDLGIKMNFINNEDKELPLIIAGFLPIIPKKYYANIDVTKTFLDLPLGSGPYKVESLDAGRQIKYERVKDYWAKDLPVNKGQYNFDTIVYDYYKDVNVLIEAFKVGDYDYRREYNVKRWFTEYDFNAVNDGASRLPASADYF